jgi:hypothetical protein
MTQGRWIDAFEASRAAWNHTENALGASQLAQFVAAAAGDQLRLQDAVQAQAELADDLPTTQAARQIGLTLNSLLAGRVDEARMGYLHARRILEEIGYAHSLAQFQLAVGHLAGDQFREAAEAAEEAEDYFHERGADAYVATYRAHAVRGPTVGAAPQTRVADEVAEAEPSSAG